MKPEEIHLGDWARILVGEVPASFYLEAIIRVVFIYLLLIVAMRLMGNRMGKVLTRNEMVAMVSLAGANGVALMAPDRGLLPVVAVAAVIIGYQQLIAWQALKHPKFESLVLDDVSVLVEDGCLQLSSLAGSGLSRERFLAHLRKDGLRNLGAVQRVYFEAFGEFTILQFDEPRPGLSIVPLQDTTLRDEQEKVPGQFACISCGHVVPAEQAPNTPCPRCHQQEWQPAVLK
jgi:uncharacterized membrane protein YcaP (DUF421 family)